jgi:hypothetical protein
VVGALSLQQALPDVLPDAPRAAPEPPRPSRWANVFPLENALLDRYLDVLSDTAVRLYLYLRRHANRRVVPEYCDRGYDRLAQDLRRSRRMVVYGEQELEAQGLIEKHAWQGRDGVNRYYFPAPTSPQPGVPKPWRRPSRRKARQAQAQTPSTGRDESAMRCTSKSAMRCTHSNRGYRSKISLKGGEPWDLWSHAREATSIDPRHSSSPPEGFAQ